MLLADRMFWLFVGGTVDPISTTFLSVEVDS